MVISIVVCARRLLNETAKIALTLTPALCPLFICSRTGNSSSVPEVAGCDQRVPSASAVENRSTHFPPVDAKGDKPAPNAWGFKNGGNPEGDVVFDRLLSTMPHSVWQPNAVVRRHRTRANLYWLALLVGYAFYIALVSGYPVRCWTT